MHKARIIKICVGVKTPAIKPRTFGWPMKRARKREQYVIVTTSKDCVVLFINNQRRRFDVTPDVPTKIVIEDELTTMERFASGHHLNGIYGDVVNKSIYHLDMRHLDLSKCYNFNMAFWATNIREILLPQINVTCWNNTFYTCYGLNSVDISMVDFSIKDYMVGATCSGMFAYCNYINKITFGKNLQKSFDFHFGRGDLWDKESLASIMDGLGVVENETISFGASAYNHLTQEQIAIATSKGWTVVKS